MRSEVSISVQGQTFTFHLEGAAVLSNEEGRLWLDAQFVALECEPLRASGKLLLADKVVVLARDAGAARFADPVWGQAFAAAASAALGKPTLRVDADALSVTY